jgi:hypothetical protein
MNKMSHTFTIDDLHQHIQIFIDAYKKYEFSSGVDLEEILVSCADHIDRMYPHIRRETLIDTNFHGMDVHESVKNWVENSSELGDIGDNGFIRTDIYSLHGSYYDWCSEQDYDDSKVVDYYTLYKMLRALGYKVHF